MILVVFGPGAEHATSTTAAAIARQAPESLSVGRGVILATHHNSAECSRRHWSMDQKEAKRTIVLTPGRNALAAALFEHKQVKRGEAMPQSRAHKTYEARRVSAAVSAVGAAISFVTRDDEEITVTMDRQTLALLQHHIAHAIAPVSISSEQP